MEMKMSLQLHYGVTLDAGRWYLPPTLLLQQAAHDALPQERTLHAAARLQITALSTHRTNLSVHPAAPPPRRGNATAIAIWRACMVNDMLFTTIHKEPVQHDAQMALPLLILLPQTGC